MNEYRETNAWEKFFASTINVVFTLILFIPFALTSTGLNLKKGALIGLFFIYNMAIIPISHNRCLGMYVTRTYWKDLYPVNNQVTYAILYTASFATVVLHIFFPGDLLLFNLLFIQLPFVLTTKTTFHGYFSGKMTTITKK